MVHDEGERGKAVLWLKVPVHISQEGHSLGGWWEYGKEREERGRGGRGAGRNREKGRKEEEEEEEEEDRKRKGEEVILENLEIKLIAPIQVYRHLFQLALPNVFRYKLHWP